MARQPMTVSVTVLISAMVDVHGDGEEEPTEVEIADTRVSVLGTNLGSPIAEPKRSRIGAVIALAGVRATEKKLRDAGEPTYDSTSTTRPKADA